MIQYARSSYYYNNVYVSAPLFSAVCTGRCQNGGVCVYENAMAGCKCLEGFSGELCEIGLLYFNQFIPSRMLDYYFLPNLQRNKK